MREAKLEKTILIVGAGNLGTALGRSLQGVGMNLMGLWNRRQPAHWVDGLPYIIGEWKGEFLEEAELIFLTLSDDVIEDFAQFLVQRGGVKGGQYFVHCSGRQSSEVLKVLEEAGALVGSCHPLQPVTSVEERLFLFEGIAVGVEGKGELKDVLERFVLSLGGRVFSLEGIERSLYHASAVMASNFVVALMEEARQLMIRSGVSEELVLELLMPLLKDAVDNIDKKGTRGALTGPFLRGDRRSIEGHLEVMKSFAPQLLALYKALGHSTLSLAKSIRQKKGLSLEPIEEIEKILDGN